MAGTNAPASSIGKTVIGKTVIGKRVNRSRIGKSRIGRSTIGKSTIGRVITGGIPALAVMGAALMAGAIMGVAHAQSTPADNTTITAITSANELTGDNQTITNSNNYTVNTPDSTNITHGVLSIAGDNGKIVNSGEIATDVAGAYSDNSRINPDAKAAITIKGDNAAIENTGTARISTSGGYSHGMYVGRDNATTLSITNTGEAQVSTSGSNSHGIYARGDNSNISTSNAGRIVTDNNTYSHGIYARGDNSNISITNTDTARITTSGGNSYGISAKGDNSDISISNAGRIVTDNNRYSYGMHVDGNNLTVSMSNSGQISSSKTGSSNMIVGVNYGTISMSNSGQLNTTGTENHGMYVWRDNATVSLLNSGRIATNGIDAHAIKVGQYNSFVLNSTITNTVSGHIDAKGRGSIGISLYGDNATITNAGRIITNDSSGIGLTGDNAIITNTVSGRIDSNRYGISLGGDNATVTNAGEITTVDLYSHGIKVEGSKSHVIRLQTGEFLPSHDAPFVGFSTIINTGKIRTADNATSIGSNGIYANGDDKIVRNQGSGQIITSGKEAHGVYGTGDDLKISNSGAAQIITNGTGSHGIHIKRVYSRDSHRFRVEGPNNVIRLNAVKVRTPHRPVIENRATIRAAGADSRGIYIKDFSETARVTNSGMIATQGINGDGIRIEGDNATRMAIADTRDVIFGGPDTWVGGRDNATIIGVMDNGTVITGTQSNWVVPLKHHENHTRSTDNGTISAGTWQDFDNASLTRHVARGHRFSGDNITTVVATNSGMISTKGTNAHGIWVGGIRARSDNVTGDNIATIDVTNSGMISTEGDNAHGIYVDGSNLVSIDVTNSGTISTEGANAHGIRVSGDNITRVTVTDSGNSILTSGTGAHGILVNAENIATADVTVRGRIVTDGDNAVGVSVKAANQNLEIAEGGLVQTSGGMAHAVKLEGANKAKIIVNGGLVATGTGAKLVEIVTPVSVTTAAGAPDVTLALGVGALIKGDLPSAVTVEAVVGGVSLNDGGTGLYNFDPGTDTMLRQVVGGVADMTHGALDDQLAKPGPTGSSGSSGSGSSGSGSSGKGDVWVEVADITQKQKAGKGAQAWKQDQRALYVGHDLQGEGRDRYGLFFGIGNGGAATRDTGYSVKNDNLVLGAYGRHDRGAKGDGEGEGDGKGVSGQRLFWSAVLGQQSMKSTRHDSLKGKGSFKTSFVSLSAGAKRSFGLNNEVLKFERAQLRLGGRLGVTRGNIEAHTEKSGIGLDGLKIGKRDVNAVDLRAQAGLGRPFEGGDFEAYVGVAASRYSGGEYSASFGAGAAKQVKTPGAATRTNRFFGFRGHRMVNERVNLFAGAEFGEGKASHVSAKLGVKMKF